MLYWLMQPWSEAPDLGLFRYISFRTVCAVVTAFLLSLVLGRVPIARFARAGLGEDTGKTDSQKLAELHEGKRGTPTMGGVFLVGGLLIASVLWMRFDGGNTYS